MGSTHFGSQSTSLLSNELLPDPELAKPWCWIQRRPIVRDGRCQHIVCRVEGRRRIYGTGSRWLGARERLLSFLTFWAVGLWREVFFTRARVGSSLGETMFRWPAGCRT